MRTVGKARVGRFSAIGMFALLLMSYSLNAADRQLFPLLLHDVRETFHFSLSNAGLLSTIFTLGLAIAGLPTGFLLTRLSRKLVVLVGIATFSTATILIAASRGLFDMLFYLAATGVGEAMQLTVIIAIAASYFVNNRAAAIGAINFCFGLGAFTGPIVASLWLLHFGNWRAPMIIFGCLGYAVIVVISLFVRPWLTEARSQASTTVVTGGAQKLLNYNTIILTILSVIGGFVLYGFTGMYPTFLREGLHYSASDAAIVASFYGVGALVSIAGGWIGDRVSPRVLLSVAFCGMASLGYLCFHGQGSRTVHAALTFAFGAIGSGTIFVNLAGYHVKSVSRTLASRVSGVFVTAFYAAGAVAGLLMGKIAGHGGWLNAGLIQISILSVVAAFLALFLKPKEMCL